MTLALETYQNEGKHLSSPSQTLKNEGFYRKHTVRCIFFNYGGLLILWSCLQVFVCCDADDCQKEFSSSVMNLVIDKYANTITLFVTVPPPPINPKLNPDGTPKLTNGTLEGFKDNFVQQDGKDVPCKDGELNDREGGGATGDRGGGATDDVGVEGGGAIDDRGVEGGGANDDRGGGATDDGVKGGVVNGDEGVKGGDDSEGVEGGGATDDGGVGVTGGDESATGRSECSSAAVATPPVSSVGGMEDVNRPLQRSKLM